MQTHSVLSFHHSLSLGNPRTISCHMLVSRDVSLRDPNSFLNLWEFVCPDFFYAQFVQVLSEESTFLFH